jgi:hypothetical protein
VALKKPDAGAGKSAALEPDGRALDGLQSDDLRSADRAQRAEPVPQVALCKSGVGRSAA